MRTWGVGALVLGVLTIGYAVAVASLSQQAAMAMAGSASCIVGAVLVVRGILPARLDGMAPGPTGPGSAADLDSLPANPLMPKWPVPSSDAKDVE